MPIIDNASYKVSLLTSPTPLPMLADIVVVQPHVSTMLIILFISFIAVSFPGLSLQVSFLRIPHILFFIGKHFGTGVILATAFIHLLPDSFEALRKSIVKERYFDLGKWTGLIILASLLSIFLIEYISTTYVDHLYSKSSPPPSPAQSPQSRSPSRIDLRTTPILYTIPASPPALPTVPSEVTPLVPKPTHSQSGSRSHQSTAKRTTLSSYLQHAHITLPQGQASKLLPIDLLTNNPRMLNGGLMCVCDHCECGDESGLKVDVRQPEEGHSLTASHSSGEQHNDNEEGLQIGRGRQVIGILVLQFGIMIHSFVIGMTLSITSGADFTSLTTAIIFHQLFEGLSLGIRIAALPKASLSGTSTPPAIDRNTDNDKDNMSTINWLKLTLSVLFAITTPVGMVFGFFVFRGSGDMAKMYLTQGIMSAISAGMLIYVATVEMLAGDFVFGDVEGGHGHGGHSHGDNSQEGPSLFGGHSDGHSVDDLEGAEEHEDKRRDGGIRKKVLAVLSLLGGVAGMVLVGLGE